LLTSPVENLNFGKLVPFLEFFLFLSIISLMKKESNITALEFPVLSLRIYVQVSSFGPKEGTQFGYYIELISSLY
jgi:hypothetical protein